MKTPLNCKTCGKLIEVKKYTTGADYWCSVKCAQHVEPQDMQERLFWAEVTSREPGLHQVNLVNQRKNADALATLAEDYDEETDERLRGDDE